MIGNYSHLGWYKTVIKCVDYEEIAVSTTPVGPTTAKVKACDFAFIRTVNGPLRITPNPGGVPSPTFGFIFYDGDNAPMSRDELSTIQAIRMFGVDGTLQIAYYKNA